MLDKIKQTPLGLPATIMRSSGKGHRLSGKSCAGELHVPEQQLWEPQLEHGDVCKAITHDNQCNTI